MTLREEGFWDEYYSRELKNYVEDGDEGDVWFGKGLSRKICDWTLNYMMKESETTGQFNIIDVGCGNSFLVCTLVEKLDSKYKDKLNCDKIKILGVDYAQNSVDLSKKVVNSKDFSDRISIKQCNFLSPTDIESITSNKNVMFNILIDVGTYDAICLLASQSDEELTTAKHRYMKSLYSTVDRTSIYILGSCNHTEEELIPVMEFEKPDDLKIELIDRIETPKIQFGGKVGSQVCCLIAKISPV